MSDTLEASRADVDALNDRARELVGRDLRAALAAAEKARERASRTGYARGRAHALRTIGDCRTRLAEPGAATAALEEAIDLFRRDGDPAGEADALNVLAAADYVRADFSRALERYALALARARSAGDRLLESNALNGTATVHYALGDYPRAAELYVEALELKRELGDRLTESGTLNNLGLVHQAMGDFAGAADLHRRAAAIKRELGDAQGEANALGNLGIDCHELGEHEEAARLHERALELAGRVGNRQTEAGCLENLGLAYEGLGRHADALGLHREALAVQRALGNRLGEASSLLRIGAVRLSLGDAEHALEDLDAALALALEIGSRRTAVDAHEALSRAHEELGRLAPALRHLRAAAEGSRRLQTEQREQSTAALLAGIRVERALHEAELERLRNVELKEMNESLRRADEEKSVLLERLRAQADGLERLSREDPLTGVHNRRHLEEALSRVFEETRRGGLPLSVAVVDVDNFKRINDTFGHRTGDEVLCTVAGILRRGCRDDDAIARYGGDEFVIVLSGVELAAALSACERMRRSVAAHAWESLREGLSVTVSVGVADAGDAVSAERLVHDADDRLYEAKRRGRNQLGC